MGIWRTLNPGGSISAALRKLLLQAGKGVRLYTSLHKVGRQSEHQRLLIVRKTRYLAKEFSVLLCMGRCKPLDSLNSFLSHAPLLSGAISYFLIVYILHSCSLYWVANAADGCFLHSSEFLSNHCGGWLHLLVWEPSFTFVVLEKTLESPLDCKDVNPKGN